MNQKTREINNERIMQFQLQLANETSESVCIDNDISSKLTPFFKGSFTVKYKSIHRNKNGWITQGIKISFECERRLYTHTVGTVMMQ
jgi:hypothetical protein